MLDVFVIVCGFERLDVQLLQTFARRLVAVLPQLQRGLGKQLSHRAGGPGKVGVRKVHADAGGGAADGHAVINQLGQLRQAAAANDLGAVRRRLAPGDEPLDRRKRFVPLHQRVVVALQRGEVLQRQHEPDRHAGAVRVDEPRHVESKRLVVDDAIAQ